MINNTFHREGGGTLPLVASTLSLGGGAYDRDDTSAKVQQSVVVRASCCECGLNTARIERLHPVGNIHQWLDIGPVRYCTRLTFVLDWIHCWRTSKYPSYCNWIYRDKRRNYHVTQRRSNQFYRGDQWGSICGTLCNGLRHVVCHIRRSMTQTARKGAARI